MKKNILLVFIGAMLILTACEPIEKRHELGSVLTEQQLLDDMTITVNGNNVTCTNSATGVISFWQNNFGQQSNQSTTTFYVPLKNTYTVTCTAFCSGGTVKATKQFSIAQNDPAYFSDPMWDILTNGAAGKTWVWAADIPGGAIWGNGGYLGDVAPGWWKNGIADITSQGGSANDKIIFDLNLGLNFAVSTTNPTGVPGNGKGTFNMALGAANQVMKADNSGIWSYGKLTLTNFTVPIGFEPNSPGKPLHYVFDILKLTNNELVLAFPSPGSGAWGEAWFFMFKKEGYSYTK